MNDQEKLEKFLDTQDYMVIAVKCEDGTPWAVPVKIQARDGLTVFEWDSKIDTVHSRSIEFSPRMAMTIYVAGSEQIGFYAKGSGSLVEVRNDVYGRYKFVASEVWMNDGSFVKRRV